MLEQLYAPFFAPENWQQAVMTAGGLTTILTLALLECLLSVDNAIVLATQTRGLPDKKQQDHALVYGLGGAYLFRFIAIGLGTYLLKFWVIKAIGAAYLGWMCLHYFIERHNPPATAETSVPKAPQGFWATVAQIELLDIVFSVDSVLAALAMANNPVIVLIGGCLGILAMRFVAQLMINLLNRIPELQTMAYALIGIIGLKLLGSLPAINIELPNWMFSTIVVVAVLVTLAIHAKNQKKHQLAKRKD